MFKKINKNESGQSMVLVALLLTVLLGFGAFAIDVGYMTYQRSSLQNAADSAALAGAALAPKMSVEDYNKSYLTYASYEDYVKYMMVDYAKSNFDKIIDSNINLDEININTAPGDKNVDITIRQTVPKFLGGILSNSTETMEVYAQAEYESEWDGESLPFVNYQENSNDAVIGIWGKVTSGNFEVMDITGENSEIRLDDETDTFVLKDLDDGIDIDNGNLGGGTLSGIGNLIKNEYCGTLTDPRTIIYFLSVKPGVVDSILQPNGKYRYFYNGVEISNSTVFDKDDLLLVEAEVISPYDQQGYDDGNGNDDHIEVRILDRYNLNDPDDRPENYRSKIAKTTSRLIN
jgi:hypothetical protein